VVQAAAGTAQIALASCLFSPGGSPAAEGGFRFNSLTHKRKFKLCCSLAGKNM
jgi:hypothetical protein